MADVKGDIEIGNPDDRMGFTSLEGERFVERRESADLEGEESITFEPAAEFLGCAEGDVAMAGNARILLSNRDTWVGDVPGWIMAFAVDEAVDVT